VTTFESFENLVKDFFFFSVKYDLKKYPKKNLDSFHSVIYLHFKEQNI
jgi:hypothetical protein